MVPVVSATACTLSLNLPHGQPCTVDEECRYRLGQGRCVDGACVPPETNVDSGVAEGSSSTQSEPMSEGGADSGLSSDDGSEGCPTDSDSGQATGGECIEDDPTGPTGWASVPGDGLPDGVTGGLGGPVMVARTVDELEAWGADDEPAVIQIDSEIIGVPRITGSNKTIEGITGGVIRGGLEIVGSSEVPVRNIIVRGLSVAGNNCNGGCEDVDAITVRQTQYLWIDHCDLSDGDDGNLDITQESDFVTVSWNRFSYTDPDKAARSSNLVGGSDEDVEDADNLRVTFHHNWWDANVDQAMPRIRFGQVHVFNNYYSARANADCVRVGVESDLRLENNVFDGVNNPIADPIEPTAVVIASGNVATPDPIDDFAIGIAFSPPYPYALEPAVEVESRVRAGAGPL